MEIFQAIRKDHEKQRLLMKILVETSGDCESRQDFFSQLKEELKQHAKAEERHFYSPLMESNKTIEESRHGIAEHHEIEEIVTKLEETDMSSSAWLHYMKKLQELVLHHLDEEEQTFFKHADAVLGDKQKDELANDYEHEMKHH
tara:strand:+ start:130 stop:561 length:432 start_codon:yes stop_codon:yes gene_type:complete